MVYDVEGTTCRALGCFYRGGSVYHAQRLWVTEITGLLLSKYPIG